MWYEITVHCREGEREEGGREGGREGCVRPRHPYIESLPTL